MATYAKVINGDVIQVIVATQEVIDSGVFGESSNWIQTSYNTHGNQYVDSETGEIGGGTPLRKNYAGIGYTYDSDRDAFIPPQPYNSWTLNEDTCLWEPPVAYPDDSLNGKMYFWNEDTTSWVLSE
jgi:hypothetical protein